MKDSYLQETYNLVLEKVKGITGQFWYKPSEMLDFIQRELKLIGFKFDRIVISGETETITVYIFLNNRELLVLSPVLDLRKNILLNNYDPHWAQRLAEPVNYHTFPITDQLLELLNMPTIVLVNLCVLENFPIPRLNLSTAIIASFLRKKQVAQVHIIDMQMGQTIEDIVSSCTTIQPDIIGVSINFGQKNLSFQVLDELMAKKATGELHSLIAIGNIIPALVPKEFLNKYPELVIGYSEGEYVFLDLVKLIRQKIQLSEIRGIIFLDQDTGEMRQTQKLVVDMSELPTPALDTLQDCARLKGAITLEASRGCDYSGCSFCPRDHKLSHWRHLSAVETVKQINNLITAVNAVGISPHLYFADEEFIGELPNDMEVDRVISICKGIMARNDKISFDISARADSVYDPRRSVDWNVKRFEMWRYFVQAGLDRLFVGVESGSERQLKRYGKGTTSEQNIIALRLLSALGINLRTGFVMFDHLMEGFNDLEENMSFLERTDALMNPINLENYTLEELYHLLVHNQEFVKEHSANKPVYSIVSYMLASLEVLMRAPYAEKVKQEEKRRNIQLIRNDGEPDTNMCRYSINYLDPQNGALSLMAQKWIDSNFSLMYTVKSLYKVAQPQEKSRLYNYMIRHREISHYFLKFMVYVLKEELELHGSLLSFIKRVDCFDDVQFGLRSICDIANIDEKVIECANIWQKIMAILVRDIHQDLEYGKISDTPDSRLKNVINKWFERMGVWKLINSSN